MAPRSPLRIPHPDELALPLRDLMRGLQLAARIPMDMARPVVSHLPGPLRDTLSQIGRRAETVYSDSLTIWRPTAPEIRQAAAQLTDTRTSDLAVTGRVVAWAMEVALAQNDRPAVFVSETIVTLTLDDCLTPRPDDAEAAERAADAVLALVAHGPSAQDFPIPVMTPERKDQLRVAAFAAMLYLLAERPENSEEEIRILSYAITVAELIVPDIRAAAEDRAKIADLLRLHAEMI